MKRPARFPLLVVAGLLALGAALAPGVARADSENAAVTSATKARITDGMRLFGKRRYEEARIAFMQANAVRKLPSVTLMLARCALLTGRPKEALEHVDAVFAAVPEPAPKIREVLESLRREATAKLGHLRIIVPADAVVTVDGEQGAPGAVTLVDVAPGHHEVTVTSGDEIRTERVEVTAGAMVDVRPTFTPKPVKHAAAPKVEQRRSADGGGAVEEPGFFTPPSTTWPIVGAGVIGLGGLTTAIILGGLVGNADHAVDVADGALARNGASRARCAQPTAGTPFEGACSALRSNQDASRKLSSAATASLAVGLGGMAIAVGWYVLAPKERGTKETSTPAGGARPRVTPWVGASGGGAALDGSF